LTGCVILVINAKQSVTVLVGEIMSILELFLVAVSLSMDAFAVSICKGLALKKIRLKDSVVVGLWFGGFQALMPLIGYFLGTRFEKYYLHRPLDSLRTARRDRS
jgi:hypothetical protein